ncbi:MAG: efflux RND transporter periplasmic adaptor subunit [Azospirillaceae bacterium]
MSHVRGIIAALAVLIAVGHHRPAEAQPAMPVVVDPVVESVETGVQRILGRFVARDQADVAARVSGPVAEILVEIGDRVTAGDVLVRVEDARFAAILELRQMELQELAAGFEAALAGQAMAQQDIERLERLRGSAAFNQARFEDAQQMLIQAAAQANQAQARLRSAGVEVDLAAIDLEETRILAPFDGVVTSRHIQPGEYLSTGAPVLTLLSDRDMEIEVAVPGEQVAALEPGMIAGFVLGGAAETSPHDAVIRAILPVEDSQTRARAVRLTPVLAGLPRTPAANESVTVVLPVGSPRPMLTVHKDAVLTQIEGQFVYIVVDGLATLRPVSLGAAVGERFEVLAGLTAGELAVIRGNERLRPGQPVSIAAPPPAAGNQDGDDGGAAG